MYLYNSMLFEWNTVQNIQISAFILKVCAVTGGERSGVVVIVAKGEILLGDVSGGMVVREGGDWY